MRTEGGGGCLLSGGGQLRTKVLEHEVIRGHGRGRRAVLLRSEGSTEDRAAELEKGQLPAQDPRSVDVRFSNVFSFFLCSLFPLFSLMMAC